MMGANRPSTFNPATYKSILDSLFQGDTLFAPVMGWNSYQLSFYSSNFSKFISTDVIPDVVDNGKLLHQEFLKYKDASLFEMDNKEVDLYLCPSEQLNARFNFIEKYQNKVDAVLFSPPYFDLEIYDSEDQSITNFPNYQDWLTGYWEATVKLCKAVMKPGARFAFVISNYRNSDKKMTTISEDMRAVVQKHLNQIVSGDERQHGKGEERQVSKEARSIRLVMPPVFVMRHVAKAVQVHQSRHRVDHNQHDRRQPIQPNAPIGRK